MNRVGRYFLQLRRDTLPWLFIAFFLFVVAMTGIYVLQPALEPSTTLQVGDGVFTAKIVSVDEAQRAEPILPDVLTQGQAILMVYGYESTTMTTIASSAVPVDLVWMNSKKKVVYIVKNVSKDTNLQFVPVEPAKYILELAGGTVQQRAIGIGSLATFNELHTGGF